MLIHLKVELALSAEFERALNSIVRELCGINAGMNGIMATFDELVAQVAINTEVEQSAVAAINGIAQKLQEALDNDVDASELQALVDSLKATSAPLAAAVAANTPAPTPDPVPEPEPAPVDESSPNDLSA